MDLKYFTLKEANSTLPLVNSICLDAMKYWEKLKEVDSKLNVLLTKTLNGGEKDKDIVEKLTEEANISYDKLQEAANELNDIGVFFLDPNDFTVGFATIINNQTTMFIYKYGEDNEINFYRNPNIPSELISVKTNEKI